MKKKSLYSKKSFLLDYDNFEQKYFSQNFILIIFFYKAQYLRLF